MYEGPDTLPWLLKYFGGFNAPLEKLEKEGVMLGGVHYFPIFCPGGDYKVLCESFAHGGASVKYSCLYDLITKEEMKNHLWVAIKDRIAPRTTAHRDACCKLVADHAAAAKKKGVICCGICFGRNFSEC